MERESFRRRVTQACDDEMTSSTTPISTTVTISYGRGQSSQASSTFVFVINASYSYSDCLLCYSGALLSRVICVRRAQPPRSASPITGGACKSR